VWVKEHSAILAADVTLVVSDVERQWLADVVPTADVRVLSNIHAPVDVSPDLGDRRDVMFVGSYLHPPNVDAAWWAATEVLPLVRERVPDAQLHLLGSYLPSELEELDAPGLCAVGWAPDLAPWYRRCRVVVAPLRYGAGVKGKVAEAVEYGVPVVGTSIAFEAMGFVDGLDVLCADTAAGLADHIVALLADDELWRSIAGRGQRVLCERFSAKAARRVLEEVLGDRPRRPRMIEPALSVNALHGLNVST
jgi:glycosyltransferase involved in cell wall biosynthesis